MRPCLFLAFAFLFAQAGLLSYCNQVSCLSPYTRIKAAGAHNAARLPNRDSSEKTGYWAAFEGTNGTIARLVFSKLDGFEYRYLMREWKSWFEELPPDIKGLPQYRILFSQIWEGNLDLQTYECINLVSLDDSGRAHLEGFIIFKKTPEGIFIRNIETAPWNRPPPAKEKLKDTSGKQPVFPSRKLKGAGAALLRRIIDESSANGTEGRFFTTPVSVQGSNFLNRLLLPPQTTADYDIAQTHAARYSDPAAVRNFIDQQHRLSLREEAVEILDLTKRRATEPVQGLMKERRQWTMKYPCCSYSYRYQNPDSIQTKAERLIGPQVLIFLLSHFPELMKEKTGAAAEIFFTELGFTSAEAFEESIAYLKKAEEDLARMKLKEKLPSAHGFAARYCAARAVAFAIARLAAEQGVYFGPGFEALCFLRALEIIDMSASADPTASYLEAVLSRTAEAVRLDEAVARSKQNTSQDIYTGCEYQFLVKDSAGLLKLNYIRSSAYPDPYTYLGFLFTGLARSYPDQLPDYSVEPEIAPGPVRGPFKTWWLAELGKAITERMKKDGFLTSKTLFSRSQINIQVPAGLSLKDCPRLCYAMGLRLLEYMNGEDPRFCAFKNELLSTAKAGARVLVRSSKSDKKIQPGSALNFMLKLEKGPDGEWTLSIPGWSKPYITGSEDAEAERLEITCSLAMPVSNAQEAQAVIEFFVSKFSELLQTGVSALAESA